MAVKFFHKIPISITFIDTEKPDVLIHKYIKPKGFLARVLEIILRILQIVLWLSLGYGVGYMAGSGR